MTSHRHLMTVIALTFVTAVGVACASSPPPATTAVASSPPLPDNIAIRPGPDDPSAVATPGSVEGTWQVGQAQDYTLGHCGLASPIDFDGNLWDPTSGHNGNGQEPSPEQVTELLGEVTVSIMMISPLTAVMTAPMGTVVFLDRVPGAKAYLLCD